MPLVTWIVMIDPGMVCPLGEVPTTAPYGAVLFTGVVWSATWNPASLSRCRAVSWSGPPRWAPGPGAPST